MAEDEPDAAEGARRDEAAGGPSSGGPTRAEQDDVRPPFMSTRRWIRLGWAVGVLAFLGLLLWLALRVPGFTVPFFIAFLIAYLLDPVVDRFEARGIPRTASIVVLLVGFLAVGAVAVLTLGPQVVEQLRQVPDKLAVVAEQLPGWVESTFGVAMPPTFAASVETLLDQLDMDRASLVGGLSAAAGWIYGGTASVVAFVIALLLIPVFAFYLLRDFDRIVTRVDALIPVHLRPSVRARFREIDDVISAFFRGQMFVALILTVLYGIGLSLVGLPLALIVALVAGVGNLIPYVGTALGVLLAGLMLLLGWEGWPQAAGVFGVFAGVQLLEGWVITPRVVGESVGLSPLAVIVALLVFGELFGFVGVLIAVPVSAVGVILLRVAVQEYRRSEFFRGA